MCIVTRPTLVAQGFPATPKATICTRHPRQRIFELVFRPWVVIGYESVQDFEQGINPVEGDWPAGSDPHTRPTLERGTPGSGRPRGWFRDRELVQVLEGYFAGCHGRSAQDLRGQDTRRTHPCEAPTIDPHPDQPRPYRPCHGNEPAAQVVPECTEEGNFKRPARSKAAHYGTSAASTRAAARSAMPDTIPDDIEQGASGARASVR